MVAAEHHDVAQTKPQQANSYCTEICEQIGFDSMTHLESEKLKHLEWAVEARARNQRCALRLLTSFKEHREKWTSKRKARAAQSLLAVTFSLWRAAFLAEKTGKRTEVFSAAVEFLERLIVDNAIAYPQDRRSNEWTFNYYTKNAKAALQELAASWPSLVGPYDEKTRPSVERWDYCQNMLDEAVIAFEKDVTSPQSFSTSIARRTIREARKERRKRSREFTLADKQNEGASKASRPGLESRRGQASREE